MTAVRYVTLWPGLAAAWYRGQLRGLLVALMFSWAICLVLLATFVWPAWISGWLVALVWGALGAYWLYEVVRAQFLVGTLMQDVAEDTSDSFVTAQREYLKGNWFEAEARLLEITREHPRDVAAGLLLVGVLRHTRRWQPALRRLEQLKLLDAAAAWQFELYREQDLISRAMSQAASETQGEQAKEGVSNQIDA